jgi:hypothetical protein
MTRNMRRAAVAIMLGGLAASGCHGTGAKTAQPEGWTRYYNAVDPCWPERYNAQARANTIAPFAAQVNNGHVLEQTVWNWHFDTSSDTLNPAGQAKLDAIAHTEWPQTKRLGVDALRWMRNPPAGELLRGRMTVMAKDPVGDDKGIVIAQHDLLDEAGRLVFSCLTRSVFRR